MSRHIGIGVEIDMDTDSDSDPGLAVSVNSERVFGAPFKGCLGSLKGLWIDTGLIRTR